MQKARKYGFSEKGKWFESLYTYSCETTHLRIFCMCKELHPDFKEVKSPL